jgi:hypothetical protein
LVAPIFQPPTPQLAIAQINQHNCLSGQFLMALINTRRRDKKIA